MAPAAAAGGEDRDTATLTERFVRGVGVRVRLVRGGEGES